MMSGMNIGARHLLPMYAFAIIFAAAATVALAGTDRRWMILCSGLIVAHIVSSLIVFPTRLLMLTKPGAGPGTCTIC